MKIIYSILMMFISIHNCIAQVNPVGSYDSCGAAITLTVNNSCNTGSQTYTTTGATKSPQPSPGFSNDDDVWFKFTTLAGQTHASIQISDVIGGMGACFELWSGCNAASHLQDGCGTELNVTGLNPLTTYWVRVYTNGTFATMSTFKMCVVNTTPPPPAPNSECAFATAIAVSNSTLVCNAFPITNQYATGSTVVPPPVCNASNYRDIWLKFTPTQSGLHAFRMQNYSAISGTSFPTYFIATYSGTACNNLSLINCTSYSTISANDLVLTGTYNAGTTYYLRLLCDISIEGNFTVCVKPATTTANAPIAADSTCSKAIPINSSVNNSATYTQGSTNGIRVLSQLACYGSNAPNALAWYSFTVPANGNYFIDFTDLVRLDNNAFGAGYRVLRRSSCYTTGTDTIITTPPSGTYDTLLCAMSLNNGQTLSLTAGTQYYVTVMENSFNGGRVAYKLRVIGTTPPVNDDSTNAINIVQHTDCSAATPTSIRFSTLSTQPSVSALANNSGFTQDVWYKFIAATTTATINTTLTAGITRIVIYNTDGSLKYDPGVNSNTITVNALTVGARYLIRVINSSGTPIGPYADFNICVFGLPTFTPANSVTACTAADATQTSSNSGRWLHFTRGGNLLVSVFDGPAFTGANFTARGTISASYFTNTSGGIRLNAGTAYLDRNFELSDGGNNFSNSPVRVRFYITPAEFNTLVASAASGGISAPYELKIYRIPGASCSNATTTGGLYYNNAGVGFVANPSKPFVPTMYYIDVITPNFSGFFLQYAPDNVVPAKCQSFEAQTKNNQTILMLKTSNEENVKHYELQLSSDGVNFSTIQYQEANNYTTNTYNFFVNPGNQTNYYRIKQVDKDGAIQFICKTLLVKPVKEQSNFGIVYPNPAKNHIAIENLKSYNGKIHITMLNSTGKVVYQFNGIVHASQNIITLPIEQLPTGMYFLKIDNMQQVEVKQFIKQ
jgi:hypothetical protein